MNNLRARAEEVLADGPIPRKGTDAWLALESTDPRRLAAVTIHSKPEDFPDVITVNGHYCRRKSGSELLDAVETFVGRFIAFPTEHARVAYVLWIAHTHLVNAFETSPRIAFLSPEPGSGKTRALDIGELLTVRPLHAVNCTPAALFRSVGNPDGLPTILFDEIDTVFGPRAKENEDIRGLLNAGYRKGAKTARCVVKGRNIEVEEIDAYCAVALAGLGDLPDTIMSRAIVVRMRRRAHHERVEPYRRRVNGPEGEQLCDTLAAWASTVESQVGEAWPDLPVGLEDRNAEIWEPLLAIADAAGDDWPDRARVAAVAHVAQARNQEGSLGVRLLHDLREIFNTDDRLPTETILERLHNLPEAPWNDLRGKPIDSRGLARRLKPYDVTPKVLRIGDSTPRGYERAELQDPFDRYLSTSQQDSATPATEATTCARCNQPMTLIEHGQTTHPGCAP